MRELGAVVLAMFLLAVFASTDCRAQNKKVKVTHDILQLSGTVKVIKDKDGKMTEITLTTQSGTVYQITANDGGKALEQKDNTSVDLSGYVEEMADGSKWFTVQEARGRAGAQRNPDKAKKKRNKQAAP